MASRVSGAARVYVAPASKAPSTEQRAVVQVSSVVYAQLE
ncbi:hypothetical protein SMICM304S_05303 [Streptomyces microflavus]